LFVFLPCPSLPAAPRNFQRYLLIIVETWYHKELPTSEEIAEQVHKTVFVRPIPASGKRRILAAAPPAPAVQEGAA